MKNARFLSWDNFFATIVVFGVLQFLPILFTIDFLDPIQNTIEDFNASDVVFSQFRNYDKIQPDTNIVLINIGYLNRKDIADLLNIINEYNPKAIGIDSFFPDPKDSDGDSALAQALRNTKKLFLVSKIDYLDNDDIFDTVYYSHPMFLDNANFGFANIITDDKTGFRVVRAFSPKEIVKDSLRLFFALELAKLIDSNKVNKFLERANKSEFINYKRNIYNNKYTVFDVQEIFNRDKRLSRITDKVVLLGFLGPDIKTLVFEDIFFTPMNPNYMGKAYPDMYGLVIHANVISMVIEEDYIYALPFWLVIIFTFLIVYINIALFNYIDNKYENLYEAFNFLFITFELIFLFTIMILTFYLFDFSLEFKQATLFGIIFSPTGFEIYHGSIKPNYLIILKKISRRRIKKDTKKFVEDLNIDNKEKHDEMV